MELVPVTGRSGCQKSRPVPSVALSQREKKVHQNRNYIYKYFENDRSDVGVKVFDAVCLANSEYHFNDQNL
jgi:hypothetical protein